MIRRPSNGVDSNLESHFTLLLAELAPAHPLARRSLDRSINLPVAPPSSGTAPNCRGGTSVQQGAQQLSDSQSDVS